MAQITRRRMTRRSANTELQRIWKEATVAYICIVKIIELYNHTQLSVY